MSKFEVMTNNLRNSASRLMEDASTLRGYSGTVEDIRKRLDFSDELNRSVGYSLQMIVYALNEEARGCSSLSSGLSEAVQRYEDAEQTICGKAQIAWGKAVGVRPGSGDGNGFDVGDGSGGENGSAPYDITNPIWKMIYKSAVAAAGPLGTLFDAGINIAGDNTKDVISDFIKLAGGYIKNSKGTSINWKDWKKSETSINGIVKDAVGKYTDFSTVRKGFSTVCNWASAIVTSGFDNYNEFGNFGARFWEETAAETLLKVGEGVAIGVGVGIAFAGAPAIAVGAAAAGVTVLVDWGLNSLVSLATNGAQTKWTEAVSDSICDAGEQVAGWLKNTVTNGVSTIKNTIQNLTGSICQWGAFSFG